MSIKLSINKLIQKSIISPVLDRLIYDETNKVTTIQVYANNTKLKDNALVFFCCNVEKAELPDLVSDLDKVNSYGVFFVDDFDKDKDFNEIRNLNRCFLLHEGESLDDAISYCYKQLYSKTTHYGEIALNTMECLFDELSKYKNEDDHIIRIASDLLKCPVAFAKSDFSLQRAPSIPRDYYLQAPFCVDGDVFDWDKALFSFYLNSAVLNPKLGTGIAEKNIAGYVHKNQYCKANNCQIFIFPILDYSVCYGYLLLSVDDNITALSTEKSIILQQIKFFFKYEVTKSDEIAQTINRYYDFILDELIESEHTDFEKLMQKYGLVKKLLYKNYYVLAVSRSHAENKDMSFYELLTSQQFNIIFSQITNTLNSADFFLFERKDYFILVVPSALVQKEETFYELEMVFRNFLSDSYMGIGVSKSVSVENVRDAYFQSRKALALSQTLSDKKMFFYDNLGILTYFFDNANNVNDSPLIENYNKYINPLKQYDKTHTSDLLETLKVYVECCGSPSAVCKALAIHKNTLYSRLKKISAIIDSKLSDSDVLFNVTLGLKTDVLITTGILQKEIDP